MNDRERQADRLLSGGHPSGARLDRVWSEIEPKVAPRRSRSVLALLFGAVPVAAVLALVFFTLPGGFKERGLDAPLAEATCGSSDAPCRVGEPVHLRLMPGSGEAYVHLVEKSERKLLAGPLRLSERESVPVPVKITPEERDIADRIRLEITVGESFHTLVLTVVP
jgi:hypothetical protein